MRVIGIGDNVCDKYVHQSTMYPGGQALNFAVYARMLGVESAYLGVFGSDEVAAHVRQTLDRRGVDRSRCRQYEGENGCARVSLVNGDRVFLGSNRGGVLREHPLELDGEDLAYIGGFDLCHTTNNSYMDEQLPRLREAGGAPCGLRLPLLRLCFPGAGSGHLPPDAGRRGGDGNRHPGQRGGGPL